MDESIEESSALHGGRNRAKPAAPPHEIGVYVGRQPIVDREKRVVAYELLYRAGEENVANVCDGTLATSEVLLSAFMDIGLDRLVGPHRAFVNLPRSFLCGERPLPVAPDRVVLEVLEDVVADERVREGVRDLASRGYSIALDDFELTTPNAALIPQADILKLDVLGASPQQIANRVRAVRGSGAKLLAEKVETEAEFALCRSLGFDYFQGYFLSRPTIVRGRRASPSQLAVLRMLGELANASADLQRLGDIVGRDVTLSYNLTKIAGSALYNRGREVTSIRQAVLLLGLEELRSWATLLSLTRLGNTPESSRLAMVRGKMSEALADLMGDAPLRDAAFTTGMFSTLDTILGIPIETVVEQLALSPQVEAALLRREGSLGDILTCVVQYEQADPTWSAHIDLPSEAVVEAYLTAIGSADRALANLEASDL